MSTAQSRRQFLQTTAALAGASMPYWHTAASSRALGHTLVNDRPVLGCIGTGDRWHGGIVQGALQHFDCVAVCDVDKNHAESGKNLVKEIQGKRGRDADVATFEDYRKILDNKEIDVVTIVTPDHWHSKIAIEAMRAGKDVYCEKPLTLTVREGQQIIKVLEETKRVFQVGTQQRTEMEERFLKAVAIVKQGRLGKISKVIVDIGGAPAADNIPEVPVPAELNFEMWLGQAPLVKYRSKDSGGRYPHSRTHYEFRWWYEYSGGKMTDWGAHHIDIASWALGIDQTGPLSVQGTASHPCEFKNGYPTKDDCYNAATSFDVTVMCPDDVEMHIVSESKDGNGILFEGANGRFHVSRGAMKGAPAQDLEKNPITPDYISKELLHGKNPGSHMTNFYECMKDRSKPASDVWSHHRAMTTCHLANIAIRTGQKIDWDSKAQKITNASELNSWLSREQRKGYEIDVNVEV